MAQNDVTWPSEDEDFDAVHGKPASSTKTIAVAGEEPETKQMATSAASREVTEPDSDNTADNVEEVGQNDPEPKPEPESGSTPPPVTRTKQIGSKGAGGRLIFEVLLVAALVGAGLWAWTLQSDKNNLEKQVAALNENPQIAVQRQTEELIADVGKLIELPTGEQPTIANVEDPEQAKKQSAFFNDAQKGDKVLMYVKAGQAILYRPSTNKIILVAPLTFNDQQAAENTSTNNTNR